MRCQGYLSQHMTRVLQAQLCMTARLHAAKALEKVAGNAVSLKQQAAIDRVQHATLPGAPPVPCEVQPSPMEVPKEMHIEKEVLCQKPAPLHRKSNLFKRPGFFQGDVHTDKNKASPVKTRAPVRECERLTPS